MTRDGGQRVCVVIAAWNASATIGRAVRSALAEREVAEVIVVDDASDDDTAAVAHACDDGTGRLRVIVLDANAGPAAARNRAVAASSAPLIALLDADDFFLPGRFVALLAVEGWDLIADNIAFVPEARVAQFDPASAADFPPDPTAISLAAFIDGNISRPGRPRGELGFAKPVIRRAAFGRAGGYDERLRLGEDYALYARLLAGGARFVRIRRCGYVAVERAGSLSGVHSAEALAALLAFDRDFTAMPGLDPAARTALDRHAAQLARKFHLRRMLDVRRRRGRLAAVAAAALSPNRLPALAADVARDKLRRSAPPGSQEVRYLFA